MGGYIAGSYGFAAGVLISASLATFIGVNSWAAYGLYAGAMASSLLCGMGATKLIEYIGSKFISEKELDHITMHLLPPEGQYKRALEVLDLDESFPLNEIKKRRKTDRLKNHPDKMKFDGTETEEKKAEIMSKATALFIKSEAAYDIVIEYREKVLK